MNKIFKTAIVILSLIFNFGFSSSVKENIYKNDRDLKDLIRDLHCSDDIKLSQTLDNTILKENTFEFIKTFYNLFYYKEEFCKAKINELIAQVQGMLIKKLKEIWPELRKILTEDLKNNSSLSPEKLKELKELKKLPMHKIYELIIGCTNEVLNENLNLKEELGEEIFILLPSTVSEFSFVSKQLEWMYDQNTTELLGNLIKDKPSADSKESSAEWKEKMHCTQHKLEEILKENKFDLNAEYDYLVPGYFDVYSTYRYSGYLIYPIFRRFCLNYSFKKGRMSFSLSFPDISIFDKMLENNKVIIRSDGINKILESFCKVFYHDYDSVPSQIEESEEKARFLSYRQWYINKLLGYVEGFIDNSPSLNIKLPDYSYLDESQGIVEIIQKLEKRIQDKRKNFVSYLVGVINNSKFEDFKSLLNSLTKADVDSFYEDNKDELGDIYINKFNNILCDEDMLIKTISYLNHNKFELAIRNVLEKELSKKFNKLSIERKYDIITLVIKYNLIDAFLTIFSSYSYPGLVQEYIPLFYLTRIISQNKYLKISGRFDLINKLNNQGARAFLEERSKGDNSMYIKRIKEFPSEETEHFIKEHENYNKNYKYLNDELKKVNNKAFLIEYFGYNPIFIVAGKNELLLGILLQDPTSLVLSYDEIITPHNSSDKVSDKLSDKSADKSPIKSLFDLRRKDDASKGEILAYDMNVVNFKCLFNKYINEKNFDIAYIILESFSDDIENYKDLSNGTGDSLREIYIYGLININNFDESLINEKDIINQKKDTLEQEINSLNHSLKQLNESKVEMETKIKLKNNDLNKLKFDLKFIDSLLKALEGNNTPLLEMLKYDIKKQLTLIIEALGSTFDNNLSDYNRHLSKEELEIIYKSDENYKGPESKEESSVKPQAKDGISSSVSYVENFYNTKILRLLDTINEKLFGVE